MHRPEISHPSLHLGDAVRAMVPLGVVYGLSRLALSEKFVLGAAGWVVFLLLTAALIASAVRIALLEARPPRDPNTVVTRTRELGAFTELIIAGVGGCLLWVALAAVLFGLGSEPAPGAVGKPLISISELVMAVVMFGLPGFFMIYWRPMFSIDMGRGEVRRHRFGRALGPGKVHAGSQLRVFAEGYYITNTGRRLGDMVRGRVGKHTFELEMIHGNLEAAHIGQRVAWWAQALHATPEAASALAEDAAA